MIALRNAALIAIRTEPGEWSLSTLAEDLEADVDALLGALLPSLARFGLVTVQIDGEPYVITDIGMRMLTPRELARAQGFDDDYILTGTKTSQIARIGNSVCPPVARAVVAANLDLPLENK